MILSLRLFYLVWILLMPVLVNIDAWAESVKPLTLSWEAVPEAKGYYVEVAPNRNFSGHVVRKKIFKNSYEWQQPKEGEFFWRVTPFDQDIDMGQVSETRTIKISKKKPLPPIAVKPQTEVAASGSALGTGSIVSGSVAAAKVATPATDSPSYGPRLSMRHGKGYVLHVQNALGSVQSIGVAWTPRLRMFSRNHLIMPTYLTLLKSVAGSVFPAMGIALVPQWRIIDLFEIGLGLGYQYWKSDLGGGALTMNLVIEIHKNLKIASFDLHPFVGITVINGGRTAAQLDVGLAL